MVKYADRPSQHPTNHLELICGKNQLAWAAALPGRVLEPISEL
jgi:hypothetical protein